MIAAALVAIAVAFVAGAAIARRSLRRLAAETQTVVRDHAQRIPDLSARGPAAELAGWINALAEDAQVGRDALGHERALLGAVADGLTQGVVALDGERKIELVNEAARRMLGFASSMIGEPLLELVRVPELHALVEGNGDIAEVALPDGPRALIRIVRTYGRSGCVLVLEDVTTVRRLETVRRDFVANVSHELRTPVAVIRANAETLLAGAKNDPEIAGKLIDGLHRNAERLARILTDLLDLSRLDAGQYRLELASVPLAATVEQALTAIEPQAKARGVDIHVDVPAAVAVRADPKALDQILVNLIENAVKYTRAGGHVWVAAHELADSVRVEIRDDGPGIPAKHRTRVFERFYRADPGRAREAGGTGLGLSIVKHLVESMRGEVGVEPNEPIGSTFWMRLPRAKQAAMAS